MIQVQYTHRQRLLQFTESPHQKSCQKFGRFLFVFNNQDAHLFGNTAVVLRISLNPDRNRQVDSNCMAS